ncbi:MAG: SDR family NAD(P)-dependent oxidoreductase [Christensenellales bacterium]|jgi:3-oxoacyl-[acyl-carrier protein] reductase
MAYSIDLSGQVAIVTGAAQGIGLATAKLLALSGAQVVIDDLCPKSAVDPALDEIATVGKRPAYFNYDIGDENQCRELVRQTVERFGRVDILVNNACAHDTWETGFQVILMACWNLSNAAREDMALRKRGKIVNVTTSGTFSGGGAGPVYNAFKGAVDSLTRYMARRFAEDGIYVNAIAPGPVLTDIMRAYRGEQEFAAHYLPQIPLGRIFEPEDMAKTILFLCSELSDMLVGETLLSDGGRVRLNPS